MRSIFSGLLIAIALLLAVPALAVDGTSWDATGTGTASWQNVSTAARPLIRTLTVPTDEAADDWSQPVTINATNINASVCLDSDIATQARSGDVTIEIHMAHLTSVALTGYVELQNASDNSVVTLSKNVTCVPLSPNRVYRFKIGVAASTDGLLSVVSDG